MSNAKTITMAKARTHFNEIMKQSFKNGRHFIVEKSGIPMIAIINADDYSKLIQEREERFKVLNRIKSDIPTKEAEKDIAQAVKAIRIC